MAKKNHECMECGIKCDNTFNHPANPELTADYLCPDCFIGAAEVEIDELQKQIEEARKLLK